MKLRKFIQFELWQDCFQNCKFCYNYNTIHQYNNSKKLKNIEFVNNFLKDEGIKGYNTFGLIGGEFFGGEIDNPEIKDKFVNLIDNICSLKNIEQILLTSNLMYQDNKFLLDICNFVLSKNKKLLICTSYDTIYRFNETTLRYWQDNMKILSKNNIETHTQVILTQDFIKKVLSNKFLPIKFSQEYNTTIDYSRPNCGWRFKNKFEMDKLLPNFFLKRKDFINFLIKGNTEKFIDFDKFLNVGVLHSQVLYQGIGEGLIRIEGRDKHNTILPADNPLKADYIDSDIRIYDDLELFKKHL